MSKIYFVDTNVLIDNPDAVNILSDNKQNRVVIHERVIGELDKLKKDPKLNHIVAQVVANLLEQTDLFEVCKWADDYEKVDDSIIFAITHQERDHTDCILITSDKILKLKAIKNNVLCEELKRSNPFTDTSNGDFSGIVEPGGDLISNCFYWDDSKFYFNRKESPKIVDLKQTVWGVEGRDIYQNAFFELGLEKDIDIFTVQGPAGTGKTFLSLALAFYHVFEKKSHSKVYITKAMYEIGQKMGFLPGDISEKLQPYMEYLDSLIEKLTTGTRKINKLYSDIEKQTYNTKKFQILPINYIRGRDLEDCFVIIDEVQNLSRDEVRTLLSRMGKNVKCICIGDKTQIDNPYLNSHNNGLNWILRKFKGQPNYAHLTINSDRYRGPICELVVKTQL